MTPIAAVAWDIDGTLIDSEPLHLDVLAQVCDGYGLDVRAMPEDSFRGVHLPGVWAFLAPHLPTDAVRDHWIEDIIAAYVARSATLVPLPGAREAIAAFASHGIRQVCVSNSNRRIVDANIRALGIADIIEFSISLDDVEVGKPHPEPYRRACEALGLEPSRVAAVEDSRTGASSARAAGLLVAGYSPGGDALPDVDITIASLAELPARLLLDTGVPGPAPDRGPATPDGG